MNYETTKKIFDVILSIIILIIFFPILLLIIIIISLETGRPILIKQERYGLYGKIFLMYKFRTMYNNSETNGPLWTVKNDPRITKFGNFLRKSRLDELPQLINVLRGEMSIVGPRPERPFFMNKIEEKMPEFRQRLNVKPGITGLAQIMYKYTNTVEEAKGKLFYDMEYIKNRSFLFDLKIILKTIPITIRLDGV